MEFGNVFSLEASLHSRFRSGLDCAFSLKATSEIYFRALVHADSNFDSRVRRLGFRLGLLATYISNWHSMGFENACSLTESLRLQLRSGADRSRNFGFPLGLGQSKFEPWPTDVRRCLLASSFSVSASSFLVSASDRCKLLCLLEPFPGRFARVQRKSKFFVGEVVTKKVQRFDPLCSAWRNVFWDLTNFNMTQFLTSIRNFFCYWTGPSPAEPLFSSEPGHPLLSIRFRLVGKSINNCHREHFCIYVRAETNIRICYDVNISGQPPRQKTSISRARRWAVFSEGPFGSGAPVQCCVGAFLANIPWKWDFEPSVTLNNIIIAKRVSGF